MHVGSHISVLILTVVVRIIAPLINKIKEACKKMICTVYTLIFHLIIFDFHFQLKPANQFRLVLAVFFSAGLSSVFLTYRVSVFFHSLSHI